MAAHGEQGQPGLQRREPTHVLEIQGVQEQESADPCEGQHRYGTGPGERSAGEEAHLQERLAPAQLVANQRGQAQAGQGKHPQRLRRGPAGAGSLDDGVGQRGQARDDSTWPTGSSGRARSAFESGTYLAVSRIAASSTGTLTKNTARQLEASTRAPPTTDRGVEPHDEQAQAADGQHDEPAAAGQLGHTVRLVSPRPGLRL